MKEKVAGVIERAMTQTDVARDLQLYGFDKLLIRLSDTTIAEMPVRQQRA